MIGSRVNLEALPASTEGMLLLILENIGRLSMDDEPAPRRIRQGGMRSERATIPAHPRNGTESLHQRFVPLLCLVCAPKRGHAGQRLPKGPFLAIRHGPVVKERVVRLTVALGQDHLLTNGQPLHVRHNVNQLVPVVSRAVGSASEDTTPVSGTP